MIWGTAQSAERGSAWRQMSASAVASGYILMSALMAQGACAQSQGPGVPLNERSRLKDWGLPGDFNCEVPPADKGSYTVVVVGAGVAGLSAAHQLKRRGICEVLVVEAQDRLGGRVKEVENIAPWPLDAGASIIHGEKSIVRQLTKNPRKGLEIAARKSEFINYVFWSDSEELLYIYDYVPEFYELYDAIYELEEDYGAVSPSTSVLDTLTEYGFDERGLSLGVAAAANEYGARDLHTMGAAELGWADYNWEDGELNYFKQGTFKPLVDWLASDVPVRLSWPVASVEWGPSTGATVTGANGEVVQAQAVVIAVPLTQLKKRAITFAPALPAPFLSLVDTINIHNVVKVFAVFKDTFWKRSVHKANFRNLGRFDGMYCPGTNYPQVWTDGDPTQFLRNERIPSNTSEYKVLIAFAHDATADNLSAMGEAEAVSEFVALLDRIFTRRNPNEGEDPNGLATESFVRGGMVDWSKEPYIEAGYSSPTVGLAPGARDALRSVEGGVLFFAGEHTSVYGNAALQGAMETGRRAAMDVAAALA